MTTNFKAACIQTNAGADIGANIAAASDLVRRARDAGADLIALPETVNIMDADRKSLRAKVSKEQGNPELAAFQELARETGAWILIGSLAIDHPESGKLANRSFLLDGGGNIQARYDKIHMFDVNLGGSESHRESSAYQAGSRAVVAETPWGGLGMTICYDLRFAHLYRDLAKAGADILATPAAFTRISGEAHWHVLQRARAIETGCFVIAPTQCGDHPGGRQTFGHSLIVDPWGRVLADGAEETGFIVADMDMALVAEARHKIPALTHDRDYTLSQN
ncbi:MAG: carbon-nitrogen hydrolase family protein [Rhodospirillaceae bacterium]|nr:carbon-nitrogen hydrolase family protein [Rhodospirillaceae bacterium]